MSSPPGLIRREVEALSGVRIIGAAWVALYHFRPQLTRAFPGVERLVEPVLSAGYLGVSLFFLLSGFVIWRNYGEKLARRPVSLASVRFLILRVGRLWPVNLLATSMSVPILLLVHYGWNDWGAGTPPWFNWQSWLATVAMVQEVGRPQIVFMWNQPTWTVDVEFLIYLAFPFLAVILYMSRRAPGWALLVMASALCVAESLALTRAPTLPQAPYWWLLRLIVYFIVGALLAQAAVRHARVPRSTQWLLPLGMLALLYAGRPIWVTPLIALWLYSLAVSRGPVSRCLSTMTLRTAGYASYSLYMLHWAAFIGLDLLVIGVPWLGATWVYRLLVVAALPMLGGLSYLSWRFYEEPARAGFRRLAQRLPDKTAMAVSAAETDANG